MKRLRHLLKPIRPLPYLVRATIGGLLLVGGLIGIILPIVPGFWLIPLGLLVLSLDFRWARRMYARFLWWFRWWRLLLVRWRAERRSRRGG